MEAVIRGIRFSVANSCDRRTDRDESKRTLQADLVARAFSRPWVPI